MKTYLIFGVCLLTVTTRLWVAAVWATATVWAHGRADVPRRRYAVRNGGKVGAL